MSEREQRHNTKKGSRSSHSKDMILNFRDRDKFANKYLLIGKKKTENIEDKVDEEMKNKTLDAQLDTPESKPVELRVENCAPFTAEGRRSSKKVETKYLEISFSEKEKEAKSNKTSQVSNIQPYLSTENNGVQADSGQKGPTTPYKPLSPLAENSSGINSAQQLPGIQEPKEPAKEAEELEDDTT